MNPDTRKLVQCQSCHGSGGETFVILDDGTGPFEQCGYCEGTGLTTRVMNGWIMRWKAHGGGRRGRPLAPFSPSRESYLRHYAQLGREAPPYEEGDEE